MNMYRHLLYNVEEIDWSLAHEKIKQLLPQYMKGGGGWDETKDKQTNLEKEKGAR